MSLVGKLAGLGIDAANGAATEFPNGITTAGTNAVTGNQTIGGTLGVTGVSTLASAGITGAATVGTTLTVTGATALNGGIACDTDKFTVADTTGDVATAGTLSATGNVAINTDKFTITAASGNTAVAGILGITGNVAVNTDKFTVTAATGNTLVAGDLSVTGSIIQTGVQFINGIASAKAGTTGGWVVAAGDNIADATCPASQTASTLVIPVSVPLKVGDTITAFSVVGQIESAGNTATLDADLRKLTVAAGDNVDASVGAITQISVTADTAVSTAKTGLTEVVAANETFYVLLTATTAASTDIALLGVTITVTSV